MAHEIDPILGTDLDHFQLKLFSSYYAINFGCREEQLVLFRHHVGEISTPGQCFLKLIGGARLKGKACIHSHVSGSEIVVHIPGQSPKARGYSSDYYLRCKLFFIQKTP